MTKFGKILKRKPTYSDNSFEVGQILEMSPGYNTTHPYFCEVIFFNKDAKSGEVKMRTSIPEQHELDWIVGNNYEYHVRRVVMIYYKKDYPELLLNQKLN